MSKLPKVQLRPKADRRIKAGHLWVFSNEIDGSVKDLPPGEAVDVTDTTGRILGRGYANPSALVAVRIVTRDKTQNIDLPGFYAMRLREAVAYREAIYPGRRSLRLVDGEADGLPGLTVDRFGDVLSVRIETLGMERRKDALRVALEDVLQPTGAILRNDLRTRELEGLPLEVEPWFGDVPEHVDIDELGVTFRVPLHEGHVTGHSYAQTANRVAASALCAGRNVLDVYAYTGGWGLHALHDGAERVLFVDKLEANCERIATNAELNDVADRVDILCGEARKTLQALVADGMRFGAVVLDPPPFAKTRKAATAALKGYTEINALALALVQPGGFLFTSTSSPHIEEERFLKAIREGADELGRRLRLVRRGEQSPDHPVLPGMTETRRLIHFAVQVETSA